MAAYSRLRTYASFAVLAFAILLTAGLSEAATYAYDDNERLALVLPIGGYGSQYSYDPVGNRLATSDYQSAALSGAAVSPDAYDFGSAFINRASSARVFTVSNPGPTPVTIHSVSVSRGMAEFFLQNDQCSGATLAPEGSCSFEVYIKPTSTGAKTGLLSISSDGGVTPLLSVPVMGTGIYEPAISVSPTYLMFGWKAVGSVTTMSLAVSNTGPGDLLINGASVTNAADFGITGDTCTGYVIGSGGSCTIDVQFAPQSSGPKSGYLNITSNAPDAPVLSVWIGGQSDVPPAIDPASYNFGIRDIAYSNYVYKTFVVRNLGQYSFTVQSAALSGSVNYSIYGNGCQYEDWLGHLWPVTLNPGGYCGITIRFRPTSTGTKDATLSVNTGHPLSPVLTATMTGTGTTLKYRRLSVNVGYYSSWGSVTSSPAGINCGADCWEDYILGTVVTLTAQPSPGYSFSGWGGVSCTQGSSSSTCTTTLNSDRNASANFSPSQQGSSSSSSVTTLDIAIAVDTSGSMWDKMDKVKSNMRKVVESLGSVMSDYRVALIDYRDFPGGVGDYPYHVVLPFTFDRNTILSAIDSLAVGGGGDWSESVDTALIKAIASEGTGVWRPGARKAVIIIGDTPPHGGETSDGYNMNYIWETAQSSEPVEIYGAAVGGDASAQEYFAILSEMTGGGMFELSDPDSLVARLLGIPHEVPTAGPPLCDAAFASMAQLWPPDHKMHGVNILNVSDPDGYPAYVTIKAITQDEPAADANNFVPDGYGAGTDTAWLRAQRDGTGNGRVYKITFSAAGSYGQCEGSVLVCAPHDEGDNSACIDDGQNYDSQAME